MLKDPYNFDFLTLDSESHERDLEQGLLAHVRQFLLEMGAGFALLGSQYPLPVGDQDFYLDLLFYLSTVDDLLRAPEDAPTVGLRRKPCKAVCPLSQPWKPNWSGFPRTQSRAPGRAGVSAGVGEPERRRQERGRCLLSHLKEGAA